MTDEEKTQTPLELQSIDKGPEKLFCPVCGNVQYKLPDCEQCGSAIFPKKSYKAYWLSLLFLLFILIAAFFLLKDKQGNLIAVASNLHEFESFIKKIPDDSLLFHASRDHFSMWLMARGEIRAAKIINVRKVNDFKSANELRKELVFLLKENRNERDTGNVIKTIIR